MTLRRSPRIAARPRRSERIAALRLLAEKRAASIAAAAMRSKRIAILRLLAEKRAASVAAASKRLAKKRGTKKPSQSKLSTKKRPISSKHEIHKKAKKTVVSGNTKGKKRAAPSKMQTPTKRRKTGLKTVITPTNALGVVDPESGIDGTIKALDNEPCDAMLALVDPVKHMDKFFVLQLVERNRAHFGGGGPNNLYVVYTRWGRTGTSGQALEEDFGAYSEAVKCFKKKFKQKTGLAWNERNGSAVDGKYRFLQQNFSEKRGGFRNARWQYWVGDGVDGKRDGWYDYTAAGSSQVERLYHEHKLNARLTNRLVESGYFAYDVDLSRMIQTNVKHPNRKSRHIRRCPEGVRMDNSAPRGAAL